MCVCREKGGCVCVRTCWVNKHVLHVCWYFWRPEEDAECSGTRMTGICESPTSSERIVLLATEPFSPAPHSPLQWINNCILTTGRGKRKWAWSHKTEPFTTVCHPPKDKNHIISDWLQLFHQMLTQLWSGDTTEKTNKLPHLKPHNHST